MFKKKSSFTLEKPKKSEGWAKLQEWNEKWNKIMAGIFCILVFLLLFGIVIVNTTRDTYNEDDNRSDTNRLIRRNNSSDQQSKAFGMCDELPINSCFLHCTFMTLTEINKQVSAFAKNNSICRNTLSTYILEAQFINGTMQPGWHTPDNVSIHEMHIYDRNFIKNMEIDSFNNDAFFKLKILRLHQLGVTHLKYGVFNGLEYLQEFEIRNCPLVHIDEFVLLSSQIYMQTIVINTRGTLLSIDNITSKTGLTYVRTAEFVGNSFDNTLTENTFTKMLHVISLYLHDSNIESIGPNTFSNFTRIQILHLNGNHLKTLPSNTLPQLIPGKLLSLYLSFNDWQCDCGLTELQWHIQNYPQVFKDFIYCSPDGGLINTTVICLISTTTTVQPTMIQLPTTIQSSTISESPTTSSSIIDKTTRPPIEEIISTKFVSPATPCGRIHYCWNYAQTLNATALPMEFQRSSQNVTIKQKAPHDISIQLGSIAQNLTLLYSNNNLLTHRNCLNRLMEYQTLTDIQSNIPYLFCFIQPSNQGTSPFNCHPFIIYVSGMWISVSSKPFIIGIISLGFVCSLLVGFAIGIILVRKNPSMTRGHKRVVILNSDAIPTGSSKKRSLPEVMVMPSDYVHKKNNTIMMRRSSDSSIYSAKYMTANPIAITHRNGRNSNKYASLENVYVVQKHRDVTPRMAPPPLPLPPPPPHHSNRRYSSRPPPPYCYENENEYFDGNLFDNYYYLSRKDLQNRNYYQTPRVNHI